MIFKFFFPPIFNILSIFFENESLWEPVKKKCVGGGVWTGSFLTLFFDRQQVPFGTQQGAYVHNRKRAHSYTMEQIGT